MAEKTEIDIFVCIDSDGDFATGTDHAEAVDKYETDVSDELIDTRVFGLVVKVTLPGKEPPTTGIDVPDEDTSVEVKAD